MEDLESDRKMTERKGEDLELSIGEMELSKDLEIKLYIEGGEKRRGKNVDLIGGKRCR